MGRMGRMGRMGQDGRWETSGVWLTGGPVLGLIVVLAGRSGVFGCKEGWAVWEAVAGERNRVGYYMEGFSLGRAVLARRGSSPRSPSVCSTMFQSVVDTPRNAMAKLQ